MPEDNTAVKPTRRTRVRPGSKAAVTAPLTPEGKKAHLQKRLKRIQQDIKEAEAIADGAAAVALTQRQKTTIRPDMLGNRLWLLKNRDCKHFSCPFKKAAALDPSGGKTRRKTPSGERRR